MYSTQFQKKTDILNLSVLTSIVTHFFTIKSFAKYFMSVDVVFFWFSEPKTRLEWMTIPFGPNIYAFISPFQSQSKTWNIIYQLEFPAAVRAILYLWFKWPTDRPSDLPIDRATRWDHTLNVQSRLFSHAPLRQSDSVTYIGFKTLVLCANLYILVFYVPLEFCYITRF